MQNRQSSKQGPDCSTITDDMLRPLIISKWQADSDGVARIPYTFFSMSRVRIGSFFTDINQVAEQLPLAPIPAGMEQTLRTVITNALNVWAEISDDKLAFIESNNSFISKGIRFNLASSANMRKHQIDGSASLIVDNSGYLMLADIFYMDKPSFWKQALTKPGYATQVIHHEIEHALGLTYDWPNHTLAMQTLQQTPEGMMCSVIPYAFLAKTDISSCKTNCTHIQASMPGQTDIRLYQLTYEHNYQPQCYKADSWADYTNYRNNALDSMLGSAAISFGYTAFVSFGENLSFHKKDHSSISATTVHIVADACMLSALIYYEMPALDCTVFSINAAVKYAPQLLPAPIQAIIESGTPVYAFNIIQSIRKGQCMLPLITTAATTCIGSLGGDFIGDIVGSTLGRLTSYVVRGFRAIFGGSNNTEKVNQPANNHARLFKTEPDNTATQVPTFRKVTSMIG